VTHPFLKKMFFVTFHNNDPSFFHLIADDPHFSDLVYAAELVSFFCFYSFYKINDFFCRQ
jgi:hypothetical protein